MIGKWSEKDLLILLFLSKLVSFLYQIDCHGDRSLYLNKAHH